MDSKWTDMNSQNANIKAFINIKQSQNVDKAFPSTSKGKHQWTFLPLTGFPNAD